MIVPITRRAMYIVWWHRNRSQTFSDDFLVGGRVQYTEFSRPLSYECPEL